MFDAVRDNSGLSRYELAFEGGTAFVTYRRLSGQIPGRPPGGSADVVALLHAEVPEQFEGHGIGSALARGALEAIRAAGNKVEPRCSFIADFIRKHPEFKDMLASSD
jgi:hypothetical protein